MKRLSHHSASCSCTSCVYRSRSKQPNVQQLLADGSEIDKLYYGKYLPLRERKLLEKLIRTRAVYDDVRNQLISSGSSDQSRSIHKMKRRDDDSTEKSSAVLKMVDLVDRGHIGTSNSSKLSSCCSCCSCSSLRKIKKQMEKHPRVHRHSIPYDAIARYTIEAEKKGRNRRRRLSTKISSKIRAVHFKVKSIRSLPCACTLSLSSVLIRPSKEFLNKVRTKELATVDADAQKALKGERKSLKEKLCSCSCKISKIPMKSIKKFKNRPTMTKESGTDVMQQKTFKIKKDSLTLFREKMLKKRAAKDWECNSPACVNAGCKPEQCLKKKTRGAGARRGRTKSRHSISTRPKRVKVTGSRVQAKLKSSNKSKSSMTTFSKICECPPMVELPEKRLKSPKHKTRGILKEPKIQEKTMKTYTLKKTDSFVNTDKKQVVPESKLKSVICKCKTSKSSNSLTTILRRQTMQSVSKSEIKLKPPSPILRNKPKQKLVIKEVSIEEKPMKNKVEPQLVLTEVVLEEKKPLKKSKKSKLGHALCECKPSTKSFSSMTSISKSNVLSTEEVLQQHGVYKTGRPRQHIKPVKYPQKSSSKSSFSTTLVSKPKLKMKETMRSPKRYKQEKNIISIRHKPRRKKDNKIPMQASEEPESGKKAVKITSSFKFEIEFSKKLNPELTNREQIIPDVQPTNERRMKPIYSRSQHKKYQHSKTQVSDMPCVCELSKSSQISQISNFRESVSQTSKPRRGSVLPYAKCECDPENYARILLSRSKPQRRSAISSTDRLRRKSTGSSTFSSRDTETFTKNNYPPPQNIERDRTEISHPKRQAVRITSNFSFDIEFYRDKSPTTKAEKKNEHTDYRRKYKERDYETRDSHSRQNTLSQSRSSQSFKNIQLGHRLKRCLCTLRLSHKKIPKVTHVVSRKTMTSFRTKELVITASKKKTQTCECEPYFYTPGECNPYVCPERLKELNRKQNLRVSKDTNTMVAKKKSISAYAPSTKSFSKGIQHRENKLKKPKSNYSYSSKEESRVSSGKTAKQAVRIGSNFTFDIEFSKKINNEQNLHGQEYATGMKKGRKQLQHKGIKVYKPRIRHESSEMYKPVKTKQTHTEPFLRKCFCTLKLLKKNKKKEETSPLHHNTYVMHMQNNTFTTNRADIHYNYGSKIQPFEYMCIPEERNPCMREKPLRLREIDLQNKFSRMTDLAPLSALSNMTQTMNSSETHYTASNNKDSKTNNVVSSRSKQKALRVGSTFSCNIELLKKKSAQKSKTRKKSTRDKIQERDHQKIRLDTIGSQDFKKAPHVAAEIEHNPKKKGSSLGAALKKCFCTFKFPRCNNNGKQENKNNIIHEHTKPLSNPQIEFKSKKKISQFLNPVKSDALVPNFCFPKMCESYNCYEKLQHPEINRSRDRNVNTDRHKKSVMRATSSFNSSSKSKSTQSRLLEQISAREKKMRVPQKDTGTTCFLSPSRQAVRISSNFRIKANNYFVPSTHNIGNSIRGDKHNSESKTSTANKIKGTNDKQVALKQSYPKSEKVRKEQKSSNVGFLLKRCFCTLGLQTKYTTPKTQMLKSENQKNLPITTQLVPILQSNDDSYNCNARAIPKLNCGIDEYRYGGVPLELKLPKDPFKEYIFGHQNCTKNIDMKNSTSFEKRLKSGINLNFNEYQVGYLINTQRLSPFYQSFYALNLKVSKLKNAPQYTHDLQDNKYEPRICAPYECDPVECLKRIDSRFQKSKLSETDRKESKSTESYEKNKKNKNKMVKVHKKCCFGKHQGTPMTIRSDLSLNMRVHKNLKLKNNNMQYSRHDVHVASDARVAMSLYKAKKQKNDGTPSISRRTHCRTIASQSTQTQVRLSEARNCCQGRNKASGITKFLSKCFCKSKLNNESQRLPEKERNKKSNKPKEKGLKLEKAKDTPENKKTKPNKLKKNQINAVSENKKNCKCEETSVNKPCRKSIDANRSKYKSTASLMSRPRKSIKLRSIQPKGKDWSSCSNCVQKKRRRRDNSLGQSRNVTFVSHVDMMNSYKDGSQGKGDQARSGPKAECCKTKSKKSKGEKSARDRKYYDGVSHPYQCAINTCIPNKCFPMKREKRISSRRLRSKNTKVKDIYTPSVKSVATDTGIKLSKARPKRFKELRVIQPDVSRTSRTKNDEDKSISTNSQNKSLLKCFCILNKSTSKQPEIIREYEKCKDTCKKSNLDNFIENCLCTLKIKGGKQLTPKPSKEHISAFKNCSCIKTASETTHHTKKYIPGIKLELKKKSKQTDTSESEMHTIMPYSKKKFKKLESQTKLKSEATNKRKKHTSNAQSQFTCPVCANKRDSCGCTDGIGDGKNEKDQDQKFCLVCQAKAAGKNNKETKKYKLCTCIGDRIPAGGEKKNSKKSKELSLNNAKNTKGSIKVFCMFNSLFKGNKSKQQPIKNIDSEPLFELLVNEGDMQIMNKEEVLHNLGSTGEESEAMKIARTAIQKGEVSPPRIEMIIDKKSARVLNKEEIIQLINKQGTKTGAIKQAEHLPQLRTAQVRTAQLRTAQLRTAQTTGSHPQGGRKIYSQSHGTTKTDVKKTDEAKPVKVKPRKFKPCICGSVVCRKNLDNLKKEQRSVKSLKIKPCVCGSDICKEESQKMPKVLLKAARRAQHAKDLAKQHIIDEKTYQKQRLLRKRIYARDDKELHHKRAIENKREMKLVKKYDTAPSVLMVAESLIDLGGFGANAFCDIMRSAVRVARHPRDGVYNIKDALHDPSHAAKEIKQTLRGMGLFATFARIKRRMLKMPVAKAAIGTLESFPVTNYLVHIADKDPKHRMKKFKQKRFREPLDFQCSLFMGSLRKRPFLKVYFMCPWFYPHCLGMLKIWQQFVDIIIFLLAVVVWSPCILTMELCRYLMCFVFCSGG